MGTGSVGEWGIAPGYAAAGGPGALAGTGTVAALRQLAAVPEEEIWLASQRSAATRRAYRADVEHFLKDLGIVDRRELRLVSRAAVVAWIRSLEARSARPSTIGRKVSALASLFAHLVERHVVRVNPCRDVKRPRAEATSGTTPAFSSAQARALLDAPRLDTVQGLRDRALLSVGLQTGARRSSICALRVRDFHEDSGRAVVQFTIKGNRQHIVGLHDETTQRLAEYIQAAGIAEDLDGPLFRPVSRSDEGGLVRRHLCPDHLNRLVQGYARRLRFPGRYSAHSMRSTFITTALENGASLEDVQDAAGHVLPTTTRLYDRRRFDPARSATRFAGY